MVPSFMEGERPARKMGANLNVYSGIPMWFTQLYVLPHLISGQLVEFCNYPCRKELSPL